MSISTKVSPYHLLNVGDAPGKSYQLRHLKILPWAFRAQQFLFLPKSCGTCVSQPARTHTHPFSIKQSESDEAAFGALECERCPTRFSKIFIFRHFWGLVLLPGKCKMHGTAFPKDEALNSKVYKSFIKCFPFSMRSIGNTTRIPSLISGQNAKVQGGMDKVRKIIERWLLFKSPDSRHSL